MPSLTPEQVQQIHEFLHNRQVIHAIKAYREATGVGLAEAKEAIEEMAHNEWTKPPAGVRNYDDPVLEAKLKSLLSKGKKIEAVKIYREEYGVSLKEAKDAVDRVEASMPRSTATAIPYEAAIGSDPFAEQGVTNRSRIIVFRAVFMILLCGLGMFVFIVLSTP